MMAIFHGFACDEHANRSRFACQAGFLIMAIFHSFAKTAKTLGPNRLILLHHADHADP